MSDFPKEVSVYLHGDKDNNCDVGQKLGLTGEALSRFMYTLHEVEVILQVCEDGSSDIIEFCRDSITYRSE